MTNISGKKKKIAYNKQTWGIIWGIYLIGLACYLVYCNYTTPEIAWIQIGIFVLTIIAMIIIMLHSTAYQRYLTSRQIKALGESTKTQVQELQKLTHQQIEATRESTEKQITAIQNASEKQVTKLQESTQSQIEAIKESTDRQIEVFIEQFQGITAQLEDIASVWSMKAEEEDEERKKRMELDEKRVEAEEERLRLLKETHEKEAKEFKDRIERIKPCIYTSLEEKGYALFWDHLWLGFYNLGGDGTDLKIDSLIFKSLTKSGSSFKEKFDVIKREKMQSFDCGNVNNFRAYDQVKVQISVRDSDERRYVGEIIFNKTDDRWQEIPITATPG